MYLGREIGVFQRPFVTRLAHLEQGSAENRILASDQLHTEHDNMKELLRNRIQNVEEAVLYLNLKINLVPLRSVLVSERMYSDVSGTINPMEVQNTGQINHRTGHNALFSNIPNSRSWRDVISQCNDGLP